MLNTIEVLVYTTQCREFVKEHASANLITLELFHEPVFGDLTLLHKELFSAYY